MKLKQGINVSYDEYEKSYVFDFSQAKVKKVTSRMFPILLGKNEYQGVGYGVLERCGFLEFEQIDPYYMVRGALAEYLANLFLIESYKSRGVEIETKTFTPEQVGYDNFKKNIMFGGVLDIAISSPQEQRAVIEVKSKSLKDLDKIYTQKNPSQEEVMQGEMLAHLSKVDKLLMVYVFFSPEQEKQLKELVKVNENIGTQEIMDTLHWELGSFENQIKPIKYIVNHDRIETDMNKAYETLHRMVKLGKIHELHFTNEEKFYLNALIQNDNPNMNVNANLDSDEIPF